MNMDDPQFRQRLLDELNIGFNTEKRSYTHDSDELRSLFNEINENDLITLPSNGLAHDHIRIGNTKYLLRIPKQSQMQLNALDNLHYQAICFQRMYPSGHTPEYYGLIAPAPHLPMGCLIVEYIDGRPLSLPEEIEYTALALASIHRLELPEQAKRQPLMGQSLPLAATMMEVQSQSEYLENSHCSSASKKAIKHQLKLAERELGESEDSPVSLISFDAHPGNFLMDATGKAYLVDVEKARYGGAGFDLAHATLYTSTTWDTNCSCTLSQAEINTFYCTWKNAMPEQIVSAAQPTLLPMRRLMWLWSLTWCAKWTVQSKVGKKADKQKLDNAEDWSAENSETALIQHVQERVSHYLDVKTIEKIALEFER